MQVTSLLLLMTPLYTCLVAAQVMEATVLLSLSDALFERNSLEK